MVNVLLARWLSAHAYGAFAVSYSLFLLLGTVHTALLAEPLLVFGAGKYGHAIPAYVRIVMRGHWLVMGVCSLILASVGVVLSQLGMPLLGRAMLGVAAAAPFILLSWLMRRACYIRARPQWAATAGALNLGLTALGLLLLRHYGALSIVSALGVIGGSSALASASLVLRVRSPMAEAGAAPPSAAAVLHDHWSYGRWAAGTGMLLWAPTDLYVLVLPLWGGLGASAVLKALMTLVMPAVQAQYAVSNLLTPLLVRARGQSSFKRILRTAMLCFASFSISYWVLLGVVHKPLVHWLYNGRYDSVGPVLWLLGALPLFTGIGEALSDALRALERPDRIFWAAIASTTTTIGLGVTAAAGWGVAGVAIGQIASAIAAAGVMWMSLMRLRKRVQPAVATVGS
jgi:O-antigen/teichoic acid export membrane protein